MWRDEVRLRKANNPTTGCSSHCLTSDLTRPFWPRNSTLQLQNNLTRRCLQGPNAVCLNMLASAEKQPATEPRDAVQGSLSAEASRACRSRGKSLHVCEEEPHKTHPILERCTQGLPKEQQHRCHCAVIALTQALELLTHEDNTLKEKEPNCIFLQRY